MTADKDKHEIYDVVKRMNIMPYDVSFEVREYTDFCCIYVLGTGVWLEAEISTLKSQLKEAREEGIRAGFRAGRETYLSDPTDPYSIDLAKYPTEEDFIKQQGGKE